MNSIMSQYWSVFQMYQALRNQLMEACSDKDLTFSPGGENPTLGQLCVEIGEVEHTYIESFRSVRSSRSYVQDFSFRNKEPGLAGSVEGLSAWFGELDGELQAVIEALTYDDLLNKTIDRGGGFVVPPRIQLEIYKEALLIFYGKVSVYLKAMGKPRTEQWQDWIA